MKKAIVFIGISLLMCIGLNCRPEHYIIKDIRFHLVKVEGEKDINELLIYEDSTISVNDKFAFIILCDIEYANEQNIVFNVGNTCYATTVPRRLDNSLLEETFSLKFDKSFVYDGKVIQKDTNLFGLEVISSEMKIEDRTGDSMDDSKNIIFNQVFFDKSVFEKTTYKITFSCKTSDGKEFNKNISMTFE